ncbi:Ubiquitin carboxyl-terminal hydrolase isozyme L3 [Phytophthora cinnamomi]|uniref:Ubiquitin carboxyl-terminal hydrolase isozyme L3 n=1 Tax=Phytophthora cinnamomi TaxID=4785 RepID=UPI00355AB017|nr:Ubiquitin carboxyl-terminal hydrolase isozyme L3 [Phytophthora cinnamomi]
MLASLSDMLAWKPAAKRPKPRRAPTATSEMDDSSDDPRLDTQPESESDAERPPGAAGCLLHRARGLTTSSKLFLVKPRPKTPGATPRKPHSRSVDAAAEPLHLHVHKRAGARVATRFGLGKIIAIRDEDGVAAIELQASGLFFLRAQELENVQVVPALIGERVDTPSGSGRVLKFDVREQLYTLRLRAGGGLGEYELQLRSSDVRRADNSYNERASEPHRPRGLSEGSSADWESRRTRSRLSSASSTTGVAGLTLLKNIATTSYTFVASKYHQGQPVITKFGAGHILSVDPQRATAQVQLVWGAIAFLNADMIDFYPKALEGTDVQTKFGSGVVIGLRPADAIYTVRLHDPQPAGKSDIVFVHESDLHRSRRIVVTAANVRDRLKAMAQRRFGERIVVAHQHHDEEPNSAGI